MRFGLYLSNSSFSRDFSWGNLYFINEVVEDFIDRDHDQPNFCSHCDINHSRYVIRLDSHVNPQAVPILLDLVDDARHNGPGLLSWSHHDIINFVKLCSILKIEDCCLYACFSHSVYLEDAFVNHLIIWVINELAK